MRQVRTGLEVLYSNFPECAADDFIDFDVGVFPKRSIPWRQRLATFEFDREPTFAPIEQRHAFATLEWGMNWCVSVHCNAYLKLHAGVVARDNQAIVMPGIPGAGKSTLCAILALTGWRVLSDEHAMIDKDNTTVTPLYRPISLKNASIDLIRRTYPNAVFGPIIEDTHKGTVSHLKADLHEHTFATQPLPIRALVFPHFSKEKPQKLVHADKARSFLTAAYHSFNYSLLGRAGFESMRALIDGVPCYSLTYHDTEWALKAFDVLSRDGTPP